MGNWKSCLRAPTIATILRTQTQISIYRPINSIYHPIYYPKTIWFQLRPHNFNLPSPKTVCFKLPSHNFNWQFKKYQLFQFTVPNFQFTIPKSIVISIYHPIISYHYVASPVISIYHPIISIYHSIVSFVISIYLQPCDLNLPSDNCNIVWFQFTVLVRWFQFTVT